MRLRRLPALLLSVVFPLSACVSEDEGPTPYDDEAPVSEFDPLFQDAPNNDELPEEGKADAVYPPKWNELANLQSPVKSQGSRGVCSIFATVGLMEHLYLKEGTLPNPDFSEQYLQWSAKVEARGFPNTEGSNSDYNLRAITDFGIVAESDWPYQTSPWNASNDPACTGGENLPTKCYTNGDPPASARMAPKFKLPRGRWLNSQRRSMKAHLTGKKTGIVVGMTFFYQSWNHRRSELPVNSEYWRKGYVMYPNAKDEEISLAKRAGHAIMIIGWDDDLEVPTVDDKGEIVKDAAGNPVVEKGFWIFKNSWGTGGFGVEHPNGEGYGYLSMKYIEEYGSAYVSDLPTVTLPREVCDSGVDEDRDGAIDCDDTDCAASPLCQPDPATTRTYTATPAAAIPDNTPAGVSSTITVPDAGTVGSLKVTVDITHTYRGDLVVRLVHGATTVTLHDRAGGGDDNLQATFEPTTLNGAALAGDWRLEVVDTANVDVGTLNTWQLEAVTN